MAFALTASYAYPQLISAPIGARRGNQVIELYISAAATDVDLDIGDLAGTFWTAVSASQMGASVLAQLTVLYPQFSAVGTIAISSPQLLDRVQVAAVSTTGQYSVAINGTTLMPEIAVNAADGELVWQIVLTQVLNVNQLGLAWAYPAAA